MSKEVVLIGGYADGRRIVVADSMQYIRIAALPQIRTVYHDQADACNIPYSVTEYMIMNIAEYCFIGVPHGFSIGAAMRQLAQGYRPEVQRM